MANPFAELGRSLRQGLLQLIYPNFCWACAASLPPDGGRFCDACVTALTHDPHPTCPRCSSTVGPFTHLEDGCPKCRGSSFAFSGVKRLVPYDGLMREVILRMKVSSGEPLADVVGQLWAETMCERLRDPTPDLVVPVPLHWRRRWSRGYNQSESLARAVARKMSVPCNARCLRRILNTPKQATASPGARRENVRGAFEARRHAALQGKTVLLIDDVLTTGATASEAARALRKAGAAGVVVAVLAHG